MTREEDLVAALRELMAIDQLYALILIEGRSETAAERSRANAAWANASRLVGCGAELGFNSGVVCALDSGHKGDHTNGMRRR